jgi:hypothetical protein
MPCRLGIIVLGHPSLCESTLWYWHNDKSPNNKFLKMYPHHSVIHDWILEMAHTGEATWVLGCDLQAHPSSFLIWHLLTVPSCTSGSQIYPLLPPKGQGATSSPLSFTVRFLLPTSARLSVLLMFPASDCSSNQCANTITKSLSWQRSPKALFNHGFALPFCLLFFCVFYSVV